VEKKKKGPSQKVTVRKRKGSVTKEKEKATQNSKGAGWSRLREEKSLQKLGVYALQGGRDRCGRKKKNRRQVNSVGKHS